VQVGKVKTVAAIGTSALQLINVLVVAVSTIAIVVSVRIASES
jgi:hypothetical protein